MMLIVSSPTSLQALVTQFNNLFDFVIGRLFVMMHLDENTIGHELITLSLYTGRDQTTKNGRLSIRL